MVVHFVVNFLVFGGEYQRENRNSSADDEVCHQLRLRRNI